MILEVVSNLDGSVVSWEVPLGAAGGYWGSPPAAPLAARTSWYGRGVSGVIPDPKVSQQRERDKPLGVTG